MHAVTRDPDPGDTVGWCSILGHTSSEGVPLAGSLQKWASGLPLFYGVTRLICAFSSPSSDQALPYDTIVEDFLLFEFQ